LSLEDRIRDLKARIDAVPRVKAGDYVLSRLHNQLVDFLKEAVSLLEELAAVPQPFTAALRDVLNVSDSLTLRLEPLPVLEDLVDVSVTIKEAVPYIILTPHDLVKADIPPEIYREIGLDSMGDEHAVT